MAVQQDGELLFWNEDWNILGLLPPSRESSKTQLIAFMADNVPSSWAHEVDIEEETWYKIQIDFVPTRGLTIWLDGAIVGTSSRPVDAEALQRGTHDCNISTVNFEFAEQSTPTDSFQLLLDTVQV